MSRGPPRLMAHLEHIFKIISCCGGPKYRRANLHTPPLLKAALSCQEKSHLHTVMVCFSVNSGNGICADVGYKLSLGNNQSVQNIRAKTLH